MLDLIAYIFFRLATAIFYFIPISFMLFLGRQLGFIGYFFSPYRRAIGYANMRAAFSKTKTPREIKRMVKNNYRRFGETLAEILCLNKVDNRYIDKYITIENPSNFWKAFGDKKGVILLAAHFDNWELSGAVSALKGYPLYVLAREQGMKRVNAAIDRIRESKGLKVVRKGATTRYIVRMLREGRMIGMVADQDAGAGGVMADLFGRQASTAAGPYKFASKTGAVILPAFIARVKGPYHRIFLEEPVRIGKNEDVSGYVAEYNRLLERYATRYYDQWLWVHRRWKSSPLKKIVILNDGKAGHVNQSLSLAESFKKYRASNGAPEINNEVTVIEVRFKNNFMKNLLNITSIFSGPRCQGCLACLRRALTKESFELLEKTYADVVISAGFSLAGVNSIYKYENNAKNAHSMKPGFLSYDKFDMVVLPRHDVKRSIKRKNVIITDTSLNVIDDKYMEKAGEALKASIKRDRPRALGVLFGGDNTNFEYTRDDVEKALAGIRGAVEKIDADLLFTTSRRTSRAAEDIIKENLSKDRRCKFLVIANEKNVPNAVGGILSLSDIIIVSGESTSMISEAVSSNKKVIAFKGRKKTKRATKHDLFLDRLADAGYVTIAAPGNLSEAVYNASLHGASLRPKRTETDWVYRNMWRLGA